MMTNRWRLLKLISVLISLLLCLGVAVGCNFQASPSKDQTTVASPKVPTSAPLSNAQENLTAPAFTPEDSPNGSSAIQPAPSADQQKLKQFLNAIATERYTPQQRAQARAYLTDTLETYGWIVEEQSFVDGINLVAERPGSQSDATAVIVVDAHYDTVQQSPGADDNGSGVAALLEIARLFGDRATPNTLRLILFDREEAGLHGSFAYTASPENLVNINSVINLEMLGYACYQSGCQQYPDGLPIDPPSDRGDFLAVVGNTEHPELIQHFERVQQQAPSKALPPVFTLAVPFRGLTLPDTVRSDHAPFWYKGIAAVMVTDTANLRNPYYHRRSDRPDTLDWDFFAGVTQVVVDVVNTLLQADRSL